MRAVFMGQERDDPRFAVTYLRGPAVAHGYLRGPAAPGDQLSERAGRPRRSRSPKGMGYLPVMPDTHQTHGTSPPAITVAQGHGLPARYA
jgi:hypothetical protein